MRLAVLHVLGGDDRRQHVGQAGGLEHGLDLGPGRARHDGDGHAGRGIANRRSDGLRDGRPVRDGGAVARDALLDHVGSFASQPLPDDLGVGQAGELVVVLGGR